MFTPEERARVRADLLERAAADSRITGAAITGSAASGCEDEWSDIDLAFGVAESADLPQVLADWTAHMYAQDGAIHHTDVRAGAWIYRVFLLASTLQVRSAIARGKLWQAEYMIAGVRNHALALACMRHDLPAVHARGIDRLPESVRARFEATLTRRLDVEELGRAFHAVTASLIAETECADAELAARLKPALLELSSQK